jgi:hypothetical protein
MEEIMGKEIYLASYTYNRTTPNFSGVISPKTTISAFAIFSAARRFGETG